MKETIAIAAKLRPVVKIGLPQIAQIATIISQTKNALKKKTSGLPKTKLHVRKKSLIK